MKYNQTVYGLVQSSFSTWSSLMRMLKCTTACPTGMVMFPLSGLRSSMAGFGPSEIWTGSVMLMLPRQHFNVLCETHNNVLHGHLNVMYFFVCLINLLFSNIWCNNHKSMCVYSQGAALSPHSWQSQSQMFLFLWSGWKAQNGSFLLVHRLQPLQSEMKRGGGSETDNTNKSYLINCFVFTIKIH